MTHNSPAAHSGSIPVIQQINHVSRRRRKVLPQAPLQVPWVWVPTCCTPYCHASHWAQLHGASHGDDALFEVDGSCDAGRAASGSAKAGLTIAGCPSRCLPAPNNFHTSFQADSSFLSKLSLKFPGYCLIHWWSLFPSNTISWGLMVTFIINMIS